MSRDKIQLNYLMNLMNKSDKEEIDITNKIDFQIVEIKKTEALIKQLNERLNQQKELLLKLQEDRESVKLRKKYIVNATKDLEKDNQSRRDLVENNTNCALLGNIINYSGNLQEENTAEFLMNIEENISDKCSAQTKIRRLDEGIKLENSINKSIENDEEFCQEISYRNNETMIIEPLKIFFSDLKLKNKLKAECIYNNPGKIKLIRIFHHWYCVYVSGYHGLFMKINDKGIVTEYKTNTDQKILECYFTDKHIYGLSDNQLIVMCRDHPKADPIITNFDSNIITLCRLKWSFLLPLKNGIIIKYNYKNGACEEFIDTQKILKGFARLQDKHYLCLSEDGDVFTLKGKKYREIIELNGCIEIELTDISACICVYSRSVRVIDDQNCETLSMLRFNSDIKLVKFNNRRLIILDEINKLYIYDNITHATFHLQDIIELPINLEISTMSLYLPNELYIVIEDYVYKINI